MELQLARQMQALVTEKAVLAAENAQLRCENGHLQVTVSMSQRLYDRTNSWP